jgi:hypothetical protein
MLSSSAPFDPYYVTVMLPAHVLPRFFAMSATPQFWLCFCAGEEAYAGLTWQDVKAGKLENDLQPKFPVGCPPAYEQLARQCWDPNPAKR